VLFHCLLADNTLKVGFDLLSGPVPAEAAVRAIAKR
jgi:hypothetical protein